MISRVPIQLLLRNADIKALVERRIYPSVIPQDAINPAIRVAIVGDNPDQCKDGLTVWHQYSVQIDVYTNRNHARQAGDLAKMVKNTLEGKEGGVAGEKLISMIYQDQQELYEAPSDSYRVILDFRMTIER